MRIATESPGKCRDTAPLPPDEWKAGCADMNGLDRTGRTEIVAGASRDIGLAAAQEISAEGGNAHA